MKRILILSLLFISVVCSSQVTTTVWFAPPSGESVTNMLYNGDFTEDTVQWELGYGDALLTYSSNSIYFDNSATASLTQLADSMVTNILVDDTIQFAINVTGLSTPRTCFTIRDYPLTETFSSGETFDNGWNYVPFRVPDYYAGDGGFQLFILDYEDLTIEEVRLIKIVE